jgi:hypothetical protein
MPQISEQVPAMLDEPGIPKLRVATLVGTIPLLLSILMSLGCQSGLFYDPNAEATRIAEQWRDKTFTECGDSLYYHYMPADDLGIRGFHWVPEQTFQYQGVSLSIAPVAVSNAEQLNGIEWKGTATFNCSVQRAYVSAHWNPWQDCTAYPVPFTNQVGPVASLPLMKQSGHWFSNGQSLETYTVKKITCDQVPK